MMQTSNVQTKQLNFRIEADDARKLQKLADECEITAAGLVGFFVRAGIRAAERQGYLRLPLEFDIQEPAIPHRESRTQLNEHPPAEKTRR